ncbi:hypothetical protein GWK47_022326 [Chionoecetes opilio]|uniref:Uncharacterized protein n=1 Tax=Chionoecetes opilio TaxID=41210 RepID=A0A8J4XNH5_CHIOP|nr:hypothetical protein GWK47_022326 [Chionoecetes opilio]
MWLGFSPDGDIRRNLEGALVVAATDAASSQMPPVGASWRTNKLHLSPVFASLCMYRNAYAGAKKYKAGISPPVRRVSRQATGGSRGDVVTVSHLHHWSPCRARQSVGT